VTIAKHITPNQKRHQEPDFPLSDILVANNTTLVSCDKNRVLEVRLDQSFCKRKKNVRFEVFTAVTMNNGVFWGVKACGCCKNRRLGGP
jgi:hypothetical protein